ncbi:hypothetical protein E5288_WYG005662 [Bos mutus]|uniref:Uncharacterized protein n=1 Tax=Bos mutus TaxID=72004 RepID=A0A6B0RR59_9CETA|nr:hypothetical protein [Bos mutus]
MPPVSLRVPASLRAVGVRPAALIRLIRRSNAEPSASPAPACCRGFAARRPAACCRLPPPWPLSSDAARPGYKLQTQPLLNLDRDAVS